MCKILIVDDDPDFVEISRTVLESAGYATVSASNGDQALQVMRQAQPDVVLLDIMMSTVLDGLNVSHLIHEDPALKDTRVIMVTSLMDTQHAGLFPTDEYVPVDEWLTKPVQPQTLLDVIGKYCRH
jgi:CheY-like chemotaxis protein